MALPSSGTITIGDIRTELGSSSGSLRTLSAAAGKSTPDAMSEFYSYSSVSPTAYFDVVTYTGDGSSSKQITGLSFLPSLIIIKNLSVNAPFVLYEDSRKNYAWQDMIPWRFDVTKQWYSADIVSLNSNGFTVKQYSTNRWANYNGDDYIAWCWRGGDGVTSFDSNYGSGAYPWWVDGTSYSSQPSSLTVPSGVNPIYYQDQATVNSSGGYGGYNMSYTDAYSNSLEYFVHGLGNSVSFAMFKSQAADNDHAVFHKGLPNPVYDYFMLDSFPANTALNAYSSISYQIYNNDSSKFAVNHAPAFARRAPRNVNIWAEKSGISKFNSYNGGNYGSNNVINCGFQPRLLWVKCYTTGSTNWIAYSSDIAGTTSNFNIKTNLFLTTALPAAATNYNITFTSQGFYFNNSGSTSITEINKTGDGYIFCAWA